jgi:hypothetical protein
MYLYHVLFVNTNICGIDCQKKLPYFYRCANFYLLYFGTALMHGRQAAGFGIVHYPKCPSHYNVLVRENWGSISHLSVGSPQVEGPTYFDELYTQHVP